MLNELNKKGAIGESITWLIATILIVIFVLSFITISSLLSKSKVIENVKRGFISNPDFEGDDVFLRKSLFTYFSISDLNYQKSIEKSLKEFESQGYFDLSYNQTKLEIKEVLDK